MRKTAQQLLPLKKERSAEDRYDIYPSFKTGDKQIHVGFDTLAQKIAGHKNIILDGFWGVFFDPFRDNLNECLASSGISVSWTEVTTFLKPSHVIDALVSPFLGGEDPLFGSRCTLDLKDLFINDFQLYAKPDPEAHVNIIYGPGASLAGWTGLLIYIDIPKNEIQYRARAGSITNLGMNAPAGDKEMYKRFYFADWIILNRHRQKVLAEIDIFVDGQRPENPVWMEGSGLREALHVMSRNLFRVRPWFEPGPWGGSWIRDNIPGLNKNVPNYAWSYELIAPENGLLIESSSILLECSFDCLMFQEAEAVLGDCYSRFGFEFPIRFDFLDTFNGGNLSLQCHPRPEYIKMHFGENFTQEETYYILDAKEYSSVYLGFREDIDPELFRKDLETSYNQNLPIEPEKYIQKHPSKKHDLFLIPYGTVHGSGRNNLVLEISTTPYIFTFKLYDWLRPDLDGKPRPLNIDRGIENLYFERNGAWVSKELISRPVMIDSGPDWKLFRLPVHETHTCEIRRYHFRKNLEIKTNNKCLVMNLVEGRSIDIETGNGICQRFHYAETFVIPAAAHSIKVSNRSDNEAVLVYSFVK